MPHAALLVVQAGILFLFPNFSLSFNAARGFVGGARQNPENNITETTVSMPHAALLVVQATSHIIKPMLLYVSMPHAALLVVQDWIFQEYPLRSPVSMPHAALLVVQDLQHTVFRLEIRQFQCRTRLCWWCKGQSLHGKWL